MITDKNMVFQLFRDASPANRQNYHTVTSAVRWWDKYRQEKNENNNPIYHGFIITLDLGSTIFLLYLQNFNRYSCKFWPSTLLTTTRINATFQLYSGWHLVLVFSRLDPMFWANISKKTSKHVFPGFLFFKINTPPLSHPPLKSDGPHCDGGLLKPFYLLCSITAILKATGPGIITQWVKMFQCWEKLLFLSKNTKFQWFNLDQYHRCIYTGIDLH